MYNILASMSARLVIHVLTHCDGTLPALNHSDYQSDGKRTPLRNRDRLANDPLWVPGFLSECSWMFFEQLRNKPELVGSEEIHQA